MWRGFSRSGLARDGRHWLCCTSAGQDKKIFSGPGFVFRPFALASGGGAHIAGLARCWHAELAGVWLVVLAGGAKPRLWLSLAKNIYSDLAGGPRQRDLHNSSRRARDRAANAWRHTSKQP